MSKRNKRPAPATAASSSLATPANNTQLVWGNVDEVALNRAGQIHPQQHKRILKISIFDPWLKLVFGSFFLIFGLTQMVNSWQWWVPLLIAIIPLAMAINGFLARQRLKHARVEMIEAELDEVRAQRSETVPATLHRDTLYMFLLHDGSSKTLPQAQQSYRFYVVFDVIRPGIVVAVEQPQQ